MRHLGGLHLKLCNSLRFHAPLPKCPMLCTLSIFWSPNQLLSLDRASLGELTEMELCNRWFWCLASPTEIHSCAPFIASIFPLDECTVVCLCPSLVLFEMGSWCVAQASVKLETLLPQLSQLRELLRENSCFILNIHVRVFVQRSPAEARTGRWVPGAGPTGSAKPPAWCWEQTQALCSIRYTVHLHNVSSLGKHCRDRRKISPVSGI